MSNIFPTPIIDLGEVDLPFDGAKAYLLQGELYHKKMKFLPV